MRAMRASCRACDSIACAAVPWTLPCRQDETCRSAKAEVHTTCLSWLSVAAQIADLVRRRVPSGRGLRAATPSGALKCLLPSSELLRRSDGLLRLSCPRRLRTTPRAHGCRCGFLSFGGRPSSLALCGLRPAPHAWHTPGMAAPDLHFLLCLRPCRVAPHPAVRVSLRQAFQPLSSTRVLKASS